MTPFFLGYTFSPLTAPEFEADLLAQLPTSPFRIITTLNPEIVVQAHQDPDLEKRLQATLCVADGVGIRLAHRFFSKAETPLPKVPGVDLAKSLLRHPQLTFFLVGTTPETLESCVKEIKKQYPLTQISGYHHGFLTTETENQLLDQIKTLAPDVVLVGMGFPKQHLFLEKVEHVLSKGVGIGVGGTLDHIAGQFKLAPKWIRAIGLEWLYRALTDPKRLKRLAFIPRFIGIVMG